MFVCISHLAPFFSKNLRKSKTYRVYNLNTSFLKETLIIIDKDTLDRVNTILYQNLPLKLVCQVMAEIFADLHHHLTIRFQTLIENSGHHNITFDIK